MTPADQVRRGRELSYSDYARCAQCGGLISPHGLARCWVEIIGRGTIFVCQQCMEQGFYVDTSGPVPVVGVR